jgi:hypothetical protein
MLALVGIWPAAVAVLFLAIGGLWLSGWWVRPGSADAYVRRVGRVLRDWSASSRLTYGRFEVARAAFPSRLRHLSPPTRLIAEHQQLVELVDDEHRLRLQPRHSTWIRDVTTARRSTLQSVDRLRAHARTDEEVRYVDALARLFAERREQFAAAAADSERLAVVTAEKLERIDPPEQAQAEHQTLCQQLRGYVKAVRAWHEATQSADPERSLDASDGLQATCEGHQRRLPQVG